MKRAQPESALQQVIVRFLPTLGFYAVHVPNGSKLAGTENQRKRTGARLKREGFVPGFPDLLVYGKGGRMGHIEVKCEGNYQSPAQKAVEAWLTGWGHKYAVCRSVADVVETLGEWGWIEI